MCTNIIGVSKNSDLCLTLTPDQKISKSGFYLDDSSAGHVPLKPQFYNNSGALTDLIVDAENEARMLVKRALDNRLLKTFYTTESTIGFKDKYTNFLSGFAGYHYIKISPKKIKGGTMRISKINYYGTKPIGNIIISQELNGSYEEKYNGPLLEFKGLTLDMTSDVLLYYHSDGTHFSRNFEHPACCGYTHNYERFITVNSGNTTDINDLNQPYSKLCYGLEVDCIFDCDPFAMLCSIDFKTHTFGIEYAKLIQQIARRNIIYKIQTDPVVRTYSVLKAEELNLLLVFLDSSINKSLTYLPEAYNYTDCYTCTGYYIHENII